MSQKIFVTLITLALSLIGVEFMTRKFAPQQLVSAYIRFDAELGNVMKPNRTFYGHLDTPSRNYLVKTNSLGMRMDENTDLSPGRKRVAFLGDSVTFGIEVDVENTFFDMLKKSIEKDYPFLQLLNGAHGMYSTGHIFKDLRRNQEKMKADAAIYFMNPNDLTDNINPDVNYRVFSYTKDGDNVTLKEEKVFTSLKRFLLLRTPYAWMNQNLHSFILMKKFVRVLSGTRKKPAAEPAYQSNTFSDDTIQEIYNISEAHMMNLTNLVRVYEIPLLIVWLPAPMEIADKSELDDCSRGISYDAFKKMIVSNEKIMRNRISFLDSGPFLKKMIDASPNKDIYLEGWGCDFHFNKEGHQLYAGAIENSIRKFIAENYNPQSNLPK